MQKLIFFFVTAVTVLFLVGCSGNTFLEALSPFKVYKIDIQQGNLIEQEQVDQLRPGMSKKQVSFILGTPLLTSMFDANRWDYYYSFKPAYKETETKQVTLYFREGKLVSLEGDMRPQPL